MDWKAVMAVIFLAGAALAQSLFPFPSLLAAQPRYRGGHPMKRSTLRLPLCVFTCFLFFCFLGSGVMSAGNLFSGPINSPAGQYPWALAAGDFNSDGKTDLAVTNNNIESNIRRSVKVLLGEGSGIFQAPLNYRVAAMPVSVAVGDFNADGNLDLAVVNQRKLVGLAGNVSVRLGNGDGSFQPQVTYPLGRYPNTVRVADFNGDGKPDLTIANATGSGQKRGFVQVLLGNGDGTFQAGIRSDGGKSPAGLAVGDLNGDGRLDLVTFDICAIDCNTLRVNALLGNGDGTFKVAWTSGGGSTPGAVALGDFNGDGKLDLAVTDGAQLSIRLGKGDGTFGTKVNYAAGVTPFWIAVADFDGDGKLDVAVTNFGSTGSVSVLLGEGNGTFQPATNYPLSPVAIPIEMVAADVNGDQRVDLVVTDHFNKVVSVLVNTSH
jgi:hypothetical protein